MKKVLEFAEPSKLRKLEKDLGFQHFKMPTPLNIAVLRKKLKMRREWTKRLFVCLFVCFDETRKSILRSLCLEGSNNPWEWLHTESGAVVQKLIRHGPRA